MRWTLFATTLASATGGEWVYGLRGRDPLLEHITRNVVDRLST